MIKNGQVLGSFGLDIEGETQLSCLKMLHTNYIAGYPQLTIDYKKTYIC